MNQHTYAINDSDVGTTITDAFGTSDNNQFELATSAQSSKALTEARGPNLWHYAPAAYLERITNSGCLRPSNPWAPNELPLLWFSANQFWEPTATKMICDTNGRLRPLTYSEMKQIGIVRFGISASDPRLMA